MKQEAVPVADFTVTIEGDSHPLLEMPLNAKMNEYADDPERSEYVVSVEWIKTVPASEAYWETGMRANQNTAFRLRNKFTLDKLVEHFGLTG